MGYGGMIGGDGGGVGYLLPGQDEWKLLKGRDFVYCGGFVANYDTGRDVGRFPHYRKICAILLFCIFI